MTCDPLDDVVENFSSLPVGVAVKYSKHNYQDLFWKHFFDSLCLLHRLEDLMYAKLKDFEKEFLFSRVSSNLDAVQGALQFYPTPPMKKKSSTANELKESINEDSRNTLESVDLEKNRFNSISRGDLNARYMYTQTNRIENFKELHELLYLLVISMHEF